jgi:hypothetical protein
MNEQLKPPAVASGQQVILPSMQSIPELVDGIRSTITSILGDLRRGTARMIDCGRQLNALKARLKNEIGGGYWETYVESELRLPIRTARRWMAMASPRSPRKGKVIQWSADRPAKVTDLEAYRLLAPPAKKRKKRKLKPE